MGPSRPFDGGQPGQGQRWGQQSGKALETGKKLSSPLQATEREKCRQAVVGSEAGTKWWGWERQRTSVERMPGTELDSLSAGPHLTFATREKYYWQHFYTFRK